MENLRLLNDAIRILDTSGIACMNPVCVFSSVSFFRFPGSDGASMTNETCAFMINATVMEVSHLPEWAARSFQLEWQSGVL